MKLRDKKIVQQKNAPNSAFFKLFTWFDDVDKGGKNQSMKVYHDDKTYNHGNNPPEFYFVIGRNAVDHIIGNLAVE